MQKLNVQMREQINFLKTTGEHSNVSQTEGCILLPYTGTVPLNKLPYYSEGDEDLRGGMVCKFIINPKLPIFTFNFIGKEDNTLSAIKITEGSSPKVIQTINEDIDLDAISPATSKDIFTPVDANFDGYKDLPILTMCGATGNCGYDFYLYDPNINQFLNNSFLTNMGTFQIDSSKQQITAISNSSVADGENDIYQYKNGQYILIEKDVSTWNRDNNTVIFQIYKLKDGKMDLFSSTTEPFD